MLVQCRDHIAEQHLDDHVGDVREGSGGLVHGNQVLQGLDAYLETAVPCPAGHLPDPLLRIPLPLQALPQLPCQRLPARDRQEEGRLEDGLQEPGVAAECVGDARGAAQDHGDEIEEPGVGPEHGKQGDVLR